MLPLTLPFEEFAGREKISDLGTYNATPEQLALLEGSDVTIEVIP